MEETRQIPVEARRINELFPDASWRGLAPLSFTMVTDNSREVEAGGIFIAVIGYETDGHLYLAQAVEKGAKLLVVERRHVAENPHLISPVDGATMMLVDDTRRAASLLADEFYNHPSRELRVHGITGTKGKTTTIHIVRDIFDGAGCVTGLSGTLGIEIGAELYKSELTTPGPIEYQRILRFLKQKGATDIVSEVSAHAGGLKRTSSVRFETLTFTNLSRDHADHFPGESYFEAKRQIAIDAVMVNPDVYGIANARDKHSGAFLEPIKTDRRVYFAAYSENEYPSSDVKTDIYVKIIDHTHEYLSLIIHTSQWERKVEFPLLGRFNAENAAASSAIAMVSGLEPDAIVEGLKSVKPIPGRLEKVNLGQEFLVIVDYAHSPAPVKETLACLRDLTKGKLIAVMGAGGSRDRGKRPMFGEILVNDSDIAVITSDNPRKEEPLDIINDILVGVKKVRNPRAEVIIEPDRRLAIGAALERAKTGDTVVIMGKGHENYQIFADRTIHFDDREVAREWLEYYGYGHK